MASIRITSNTIQSHYGAVPTCPIHLVTSYLRLLFSIVFPILYLVPTPHSFQKSFPKLQNIAFSNAASFHPAKNNNDAFNMSWSDEPGQAPSAGPAGFTRRLGRVGDLSDLEDEDSCPAPPPQNHQIPAAKAFS